MNYQTQIQEVQTHISSIQGNIPLHRRESKKIYSFSGLPFTQQLSIWDKLWRTQNNWRLRLHAYYFLERHLKKENELQEMWPVMVHWQDQVNDWGLCDALAKIYTKILEIMPEEVYEKLKEWNASENLWKRRQSVVSLLYYSRTKKKYLAFNQIEQLIMPLVTDKEYYVQKGTGWALRELRNVYPGETLNWLKQHISSLSSIAFTIAIEKLDAETVIELKAIRKKPTGKDQTVI